MFFVVRDLLRFAGYTSGGGIVQLGTSTFGLVRIRFLVAVQMVQTVGIL